MPRPGNNPSPHPGKRGRQPATRTVDRGRDLVFDVGMHRGEDTAYYLHKGYRVVAFEANPSLIEHARIRFREELESGRLTIVPGAITEGTPENATFYVH